MAKRDKYMAEFYRVRSAVLERDGNSCVKCKSSLSLEIHHIDNYQNNDPGFLATLCYLCHGVAPMGKELFAQWLLLGDSGVDTIRQEMKGAKIPKMTLDQITDFCRILMKFDLFANKNKMRQARERMKQCGLFREGRHSYGMKPGEDVILERMKSMRAQKPAMHYDAIAKTLNAEEIPSRMGKLWTATTIQKILTRLEPKKEKPAPIIKIARERKDKSPKEPKKKMEPKDWIPQSDYVCIDTPPGGIWIPSGPFDNVMIGNHTKTKPASGITPVDKYSF